MGEIAHAQLKLPIGRFSDSLWHIEIKSVHRPTVSTRWQQCLGIFLPSHPTSGLVKMYEAIPHIPMITQNIGRVSEKVNASSLNLSLLLRGPLAGEGQPLRRRDEALSPLPRSWPLVRAVISK